MVCDERSTVRQDAHAGEVEPDVVARARGRVEIPLTQIGQLVGHHRLGVLAHVVGDVETAVSDSSVLSPGM